MQKKGLSEQIARADMERLWLYYFNKTLLREGLLSEDAYRKLQMMIVQRKRGNVR